MMQIVRTYVARCCLLSTLLIAGHAHALAPDIEADRLSLAASQALEAKDFAKAVGDLEKLQALGVRLPANFQYHYAMALAGAGRPGRAKAAVETYLNQYGKKAKYYAEALSLLNSAETAVAARDQSLATASATRQGEYESCVSSIEREISDLGELNRKYATAQRDETWCWEECSRNYCTETEAAPLKRCKSLQRDVKAYASDVRDVQYMKDTPGYARDKCRAKYPAIAAQADD